MTIRTNPTHFTELVRIGQARAQRYPAIFRALWEEIFRARRDAHLLNMEIAYAAFGLPADVPDLCALCVLVDWINDAWEDDHPEVGYNPLYEGGTP